MNYKELRNSKIYTGLSIFEYLCETWKRERPHELNLITDRAKLRFKSDEILFKHEKRRLYDEYVRPYYFSVHRLRFLSIKRRIKRMPYEQLRTLYKVAMHPEINPLQDDY